MKRLALILAIAVLALPASATTVSTSGTNWRIDGQNVQLWGVRAANAMFDQDAADDLIANMDAMRAHGIRVLSVSLQGGRTGSADGSDQFQCYQLNGTDGEMTATCKTRLGGIIEAADARGLAIQLVLFYQKIDGLLSTDTAVLTAVQDVATWVEAQGYTNIIVDACNEHGHSGFTHAPILDNETQGNAESLCSTWGAISSAPCAVSRGIGDPPYAVQNGIDYQLWHGNDDSGVTLSATAPRMTNEIDRELGPGWDTYDEPGEWGSTVMDSIRGTNSGVDNNGFIDDAKANNYSWFWHSSWTQGVHEDGTRVGPRYHFGHNAGQPSTTDTLRSVHWVFDEIARKEGLTPDGDYYVRTDGHDTNCTGTVDAPYVSGTGPTGTMACAFASIWKGESSAACGDSVYVNAGEYKEPNQIAITDTCSVSTPKRIIGDGSDVVTVFGNLAEIDYSTCAHPVGEPNAWLCDEPAGTLSGYSRVIQKPSGPVTVEMPDTPTNFVLEMTDWVSITKRLSDDINLYPGTFIESGSQIKLRGWNSETPSSTNRMFLPTRSTGGENSGVIHFDTTSKYVQMEGFTIIAGPTRTMTVRGDNVTVADIKTWTGSVWITNTSDGANLDRFVIKNNYERDEDANLADGSVDDWNETSQSTANAGTNFTITNLESYAARNGAGGCDSCGPGLYRNLLIQGHHNHPFIMQGTSNNVTWQNVIVRGGQEGIYIAQCSHDLVFDHVTILETAILIALDNNCDATRDGPWNITFKNSIFGQISWLTTSGNDLWSNGGWVLDYNVYTKGTIAKVRGVDYDTIEDWRAFSGQDANSIESTPTAEFESPAPSFDTILDLRIPANFRIKQTAEAVNRATTSGLTTDFGGATRDGSPDSGAYEYTGAVTYFCDDNIDNDGDGETDYDGNGGTPDDGCSSATDNDERRCGDAYIDTGENCDGANLNGQTCVSLNQPAGTLACSQSCAWDFSGCIGNPPPNPGTVLRGGTVRGGAIR